MSTEQPMVAGLEQLATEYPETATFLRRIAPLAEHTVTWRCKPSNHLRIENDMRLHEGSLRVE